MATEEVLPARSVAVAVMVWLPIAMAAAGVQFHVPDASARAVPASVPSIFRLTVAPASVTPVKIGRVTVLCQSPETPSSLAADSAIVTL